MSEITMPFVTVEGDLTDLQLFDYTMLDQTDLYGQTDVTFSLEEINALATSFPGFDTKIAEDNDLGVGMGVPAPPCAVVVEAPPTPEPTLTHDTDTNDTSEMFLMTPVSPGSLLQPPSPGSLLSPASPGSSMESLSPYSSQAYSPEPEYLQALSPSPSSMGPGSPNQQYTVTSTLQPSTLESTSMQSSQLPSESTVFYKMEVNQESLSAQSSEQKTADAPTPKKCGRKPKYPKGEAPPRRGRVKKPKAYEMLHSLSNPVEEKKRRNAINAKRHRDMQKNERHDLANQLSIVKAERDDLLMKVQQLEQSHVQLQQRLANAECQSFVIM